ncbi:2,3-bisphosphoglycerate-independent phosphoglycerate mutase [Sneathiella sp. P13V-1]|uniref:2,3-bisphosphoglycerate-independent phosphoglycerate mutase n=1 Tax=Sneathiella sp. P13V-1 TaxID=2697366 RepID=UPI00187BB8A7|nr:2,3-bisphosphoglycerate-independent phosphoglycerate mutase [Sneathiella sp. P13V-1]MBE7636350.1 2,3-bisphosphoglycerate-independent phosphoglycerate mutase [Sneathiella sp. P13V-1]
MTDTAFTQKNRPVLLCILDGWGEGEDGADNAIMRGNTPNWDNMVKNCPKSRLSTSGLDVGLPEGQMGNSEVGHMTIGSGRVILQDLPRINSDIHTGALANNGTLLAMISKLKESGGTCHLAGLLSPGGVHSHQDHMVALAQIISDAGVKVDIHGFMDGRDTPPTSGAGFVDEFQNAISDIEGVRLATLIGRYFAMDRDNNWDRVVKSYNAIFNAAGTVMTNPVEAVEACYDAGDNDEFLPAQVLEGYEGVKEGDAFLMANFRADRARQFMRALTENGFDGFDTSAQPTLASITGMVEYSSELAKSVPALFPPVDVKNTLGEVASAAGRTQLRIAETEKYAHVTFFLNGGEESVYEGESRILVPSPKVATYDLQPEMSAPEVKTKLIDAVNSGTFDLIVVNFANPDMVGHTGVMEAALEAVETIDGCIGELAEAVNANGGVMLITADHGNIELMKDPTTHKPHTAHTTNLVPCVLTAGGDGLSLKDGTLADLAPTVLNFMGLDVPSDMTGSNLASPAEETREAS